MAREDIADGLDEGRRSGGIELRYGARCRKPHEMLFQEHGPAHLGENCLEDTVANLKASIRDRDGCVAFGDELPI